MTLDLENDNASRPSERAERNLLDIGFIAPKDVIEDAFRSVTVTGKNGAVMTLEFRWQAGKLPNSMKR
jgi:hypothetical protein